MGWFLPWLALALAVAPADDRSVPELVDRAEQPLPLPARRAAVRALGTRGDPEAVGALVDRCRGLPNLVCETAIQTLDRLGDRGVHGLLEILQITGPARADKGRAWSALKKRSPDLGREAAVGALPHHRSLPAEAVRAGLDALTTTSPAPMRELASHVASDPMERTALRLYARRIADTLDAPGRHEALARVVDLPDAHERRRQIPELADPGRPGRTMLPALVDLAFDADPRIRQEAVETLRAYAHPELRTRMRWLVAEDPRPRVRLAALPLLATLAHRDDPEDVAVLTAVLEGALNRRGRLVAAACLATRSDPTWAELVSDRIIDIDPAMSTMQQAIRQGVVSPAELGVGIDPPVRSWTPEATGSPWEPAWVRDADGVLQRR